MDTQGVSVMNHCVCQNVTLVLVFIQTSVIVTTDGLDIGVAMRSANNPVLVMENARLQICVPVIAAGMGRNAKYHMPQDFSPR